MLRTSIAGLALAACLAATAPVLADTLTFKANLAAATEVPPNDSKATGAVTATYDTATKKLSWQGTYSGLTGPATAGHFHGPADPGKNAGVAVPITASSSPFEGSADSDRCPGRRPDGRQVVRQHPHRGAQGRRNSRPSLESDADDVIGHELI